MSFENSPKIVLQLALGCMQHPRASQNMQQTVKKIASKYKWTYQMSIKTPFQGIHD